MQQEVFAFRDGVEEWRTLRREDPRIDEIENEVTRRGSCRSELEKTKVNSINVHVKVLARVV